MHSVEKISKHHFVYSNKRVTNRILVKIYYEDILNMVAKFFMVKILRAKDLLDTAP